MQKRPRDDSRNTAAWRNYDESLRDPAKDLPSWARHTKWQSTFVVFLIAGIIALFTWGSVAMVHLIDWLAKP
jgi:hypothetical protein